MHTCYSFVNSTSSKRCKAGAWVYPLLFHYPLRHINLIQLHLLTHYQTLRSYSKLILSKTLTSLIHNIPPSEVILCPQTLPLFLTHSSPVYPLHPSSYSPHPLFRRDFSTHYWPYLTPSLLHRPHPPLFMLYPLIRRHLATRQWPEAVPNSILRAKMERNVAGEFGTDVYHKNMRNIYVGRIKWLDKQHRVSEADE